MVLHASFRLISIQELIITTFLIFGASSSGQEEYEVRLFSFQPLVMRLLKWIGKLTYVYGFTVVLWLIEITTTFIFEITCNFDSVRH